MKNQIRTILYILMLVFPMVLVPTGSLANKTNIITVDDDGPADFSTIQDAIDAASSGDMIYVHTGIYYEHIVIDKALTINGENKETTVIDGNHTGIVVRIKADALDIVTISNLTIQNSGSNMNFEIFDAGICCEEANLHLIDSIITDHEILGVLIASGLNPVIKNNIFKNIKMYSLDAGFLEDGLITHNTFKGSGYPIYLIFCINTEISYNIFEMGMYSTFGNIIFLNCLQSTISHNQFGTGMYGIITIDGAESHNMVSENNFINNQQLFVKTNMESPVTIASKDIGGFFEMKQIAQDVLGKAETWYNSPFSKILTKSNDADSLAGGSTWDSNYYSDWNGRGRYMIKGIYLIILKMPFLIILPWATFDSNPASEPYVIE